MHGLLAFIQKSLKFVFVSRMEILKRDCLSIFHAETVWTGKGKCFSIQSVFDCCCKVCKLFLVLENVFGHFGRILFVNDCDKFKSRNNVVLIVCRNGIENIYKP